MSINVNVKNLMMEAGYAAPEVATRAKDFAKFLITELKEEVSLRRFNHLQKMTDYDDGFNAAIDTVLEILKEYE